MGRKLPTKNKKKTAIQNRKSNHAAQKKALLPPSEDWNFLSAAGPGCHIARQDLSGKEWVLEWETINKDDMDSFGDDDVPDLAVDPEEHTLTLCNIENCCKVAYISVFDCELRDRNGKVLSSGTTSDSHSLGKLRSCTTLIVLCPPFTFCHLCYLPDTISPSSLLLESDVQEWREHPDPTDTHSQTIGFPLQTSDSISSFLCTQGVGGCLTHFFAGNLHAIDFRCPIGTPLTAVGNGKVVGVKVDCKITGIAVTNLFSWNSILLQIDDDTEIDVANLNCIDDDDDLTTIKANGGPLFVEFVHIQTSAVIVGESVVAGQVIGTSGSIGFSPEPHLHLACYRSSDDAAPTCRVYFHTSCKDALANKTTDRKTRYLPKAGHRYTASGPCIVGNCHVATFV